MPSSPSPRPNRGSTCHHLWRSFVRPWRARNMCGARCLGRMVAATMQIVSRVCRCARSQCDGQQEKVRSCVRAGIMADVVFFLAWMAKAESVSPRGEACYNSLADALKTDDITHWTHLQPMCGMQVPADPFGL